MKGVSRSARGISHDAHGGARPAQPPLPCSPRGHWAAARGQGLLSLLKPGTLLLSLDQNQAGHRGSSVIHLSGGTERLAGTQLCPGLVGGSLSAMPQFPPPAK